MIDQTFSRLAKLDSLSASALYEMRNLWMGNDPDLALLWHRIGHLIETVAEKQPIRFHSFASEVCNAVRWSERNGYAFQPIKAERQYVPGPRVAAASGPWAAARDLAESEYASGLHLVDARDATVALYQWPNGEELMLPFGRDGALLWEQPYWLQFYPFVRAYSPESQCAILEFDRRHSERYDGPHIYLGGSSNWTHWLVDYVANLRYIEQFSELREATLVTMRLKPWQREILDHFGMKQPVLELHPSQSMTLSSFAQLHIGCGFPRSERIRYLRSRLARRTSRPLTRRLYLSRANMAPRHRVRNEEAVQNMLHSYGFETVFADHLSLYEKIDLFSEAEIVVCAPGSSTTNVFLFCPDETVPIYMIPNLFHSPNTPHNWILGALTYFMESYERTVFVIGGEELTASGLENFDQPLDYSLEKLSRALEIASTVQRGQPTPDHHFI